MQKDARETISFESPMIVEVSRYQDATEENLKSWSLFFFLSGEILIARNDVWPGASMWALVFQAETTEYHLSPIDLKQQRLDFRRNCYL